MITFAGQEIPKAPFEVHVNPYKETLIRAYGPGLTGGVVSHPAMFTVETNGETGSLGKLNVNIYLGDKITLQTKITNMSIKFSNKFQSSVYEILEFSNNLIKSSSKTFSTNLIFLKTLTVL